MDCSPGGSFRPEPPLCPPRVGNGHGGGHGGRGPHTVLVRRRAPSPSLVRVPLRRAGVGSPVGRDPRGSKRLGAPGRAVCRSSRTPHPPASRSLLGEGGRPLGSGRAEGRPCGPQLGGGEGGGMGGPPHRPPPPRPIGRRPAISCLRCAPLGYTRAVGVAGRPRASGAARSAANGSVRGGGGGGGEAPRPGSRPRVPRAGLRRSCSVCAVLGAAGPPSVGSRQGGSVRAVQRGRLPRPRCPLTPGAAASSGGVRGRRLFGLPPSTLGPEGGGGEWGGPSGPLAPPPDGRGGVAWRSRPRGPAVRWGVALFPGPPLPRAGPSCRPSLGPLVPPAVAAWRWLAGGGREG